MKVEAQRIAIATACPKLFYSSFGGGYIGLFWIGGPKVDPLSDLNACHEMEKTIFPKPIAETSFTLKAWFNTPENHIPDSIDWEQLLREKNNTKQGLDNRRRIQLWRKYDGLIGALGNRIHATAPQRCEAFLRTLGKWTDE